jgi:FkbM family methyltransferase
MSEQKYAQINQDINVLKFYRYKKGGFFLDVGAYNGVDMSNTYLLEKSYNWKGICFEPLREAYENLREVRSAVCIDKAVFHETGKKMRFSACNVLSGITDCIDKYPWVKDSESYEVETIRLDDAILEHETIVPYFIDYMSLDTEGTEFDILQSFDFNNYRVGYFTIEHNFVEPKRTNIRNFLLSKGYVYIGQNSVDDDYIHKSLIEGVYYYDNDFTRPITLTIDHLTNKVTVQSPYWAPDTGVFDGRGMCIRFERLGTRLVYADTIANGTSDFWKR